MHTIILASSFFIEFIGPCGTHPLLSIESPYTQDVTVGQKTIQTLEENKIPFQGSDRGLNSAFGTPVGLGALEIVSDTEMRSYGWCYQVDGEIPESYPDQVTISSTMKKITWFFGFAHYRNGEWVSQCEPAHEIRPEFLCPKI